MFRVERGDRHEVVEPGVAEQGRSCRTGRHHDDPCRARRMRDLLALYRLVESDDEIRGGRKAEYCRQSVVFDETMPPWGSGVMVDHRKISFRYLRCSTEYHCATSHASLMRRHGNNYMYSFRGR